MSPAASPAFPRFYPLKPRCSRLLAATLLLAAPLATLGPPAPRWQRGHRHQRPHQTAGRERRGQSNGGEHRPTGAANLLAAAYGSVGSAATLFAGSGNYAVARGGAGSYRVTLSGASGLGATDLNPAAAAATLFGAAPGFTTYTAGTGFLDILPFNSAGAATDRGFSCAVYLP